MPKALFIGGPLQGQVRDDPGINEFGHDVDSELEPGHKMRWYYYRHRLAIPDEKKEGPIYSCLPGDNWVKEHKELIAGFLRENT